MKKKNISQQRAMEKNYLNVWVCPRDICFLAEVHREMSQMKLRGVLNQRIRTDAVKRVLNARTCDDVSQSPESHVLLPLPLSQVRLLWYAGFCRRCDGSPNLASDGRLMCPQTQTQRRLLSIKQQQEKLKQDHEEELTAGMHGLSWTNHSAFARLNHQRSTVESEYTGNALLNVAESINRNLQADEEAYKNVNDAVSKQRRALNELRRETVLLTAREGIDKLSRVITALNTLKVFLANEKVAIDSIVADTEKIKNLSSKTKEDLSKLHDHT